MSVDKHHRAQPVASVSVRVGLSSREDLLDACAQLLGGKLPLRCACSLPAGQRLPVALTYPGQAAALLLDVEVVQDAPDDGARRLSVRVPPERTEDLRQLSCLVGALEKKMPVTAPVLRILLVEDNPHIVQMYTRALRRAFSPAEANTVVENAADGLEALKRLGAEPLVDLLITDLHMPVMDGFTLIEKVRHDARLKSLPILVISAGDEEAHARAAALGVQGHLQKPVVLHDIVDAIRRTIKAPGTA